MYAVITYFKRLTSLKNVEFREPAGGFQRPDRVNHLIDVMREPWAGRMLNP